MEVKTNVCLDLLSLSHIVWDKHELITMNPDCLRVFHLADLLYFTGNLRIYCLELGPVVAHILYRVTWVDKIVHVWSNQIFIET
mgnify:CR=1 FL=1